jgi:iron(III) transport system permease protein
MQITAPQRALGRRAALLLLAAPVLLPLIWLCLSWQYKGELWPHLGRYVLPQAALQTGQMLLGVAFFSAVLGVGAALLQARFDYPGRKLLDVALLLPLALPSYVVAFIWVGCGSFGTPLYYAWRALFGADAQAPAARGVWGGIWVFSLCLYPYVFLIVRAACRGVPQSLIDAARLLKLNPRQRLTRLYWPLLRPALVLGLCLVLMETLADFGAASLLGIETLTTSVYKAWYSLQSLQTAAQLASLGVVAVLLLLMLEHRSRARLRQSLPQGGALPRVPLRGAYRWLAPCVLFGLVALSFILPVLQLLLWAGARWHTDMAASAADLEAALFASAKLAGLAAACVTVLGLSFALLERASPHDPGLARWALPFGLGYAVPGTVLAVALLLTLSSLGAPGQWLLAGIGALLLAYVARFARMGASPATARLAQVSQNLPDAARTLGLKPWQRLRYLYLPLLGGSVVNALLLVFVEVLKELPATLVLRPLGWDTLAIKVYGYTSEGLWQQAATPALILVAAGVVAVVLLGRLAPAEAQGRAN